MFLRSIEKFINRDDVCQTILAVSPEDMEMVKQKFGPNLGFMGVKLAEGGAERQDTVSKALQKVAEEAEYVAVHDAARPCVSDDMIDAVFAEAAKSGAAILASAITGTLKRVSEAGVVDETISRERVYEAQTPQVFRRDLLLQAYGKIGQAEGPFTDDAQLLEQMGHPVTVAASDPTNLKITRPGDMTLAAAIIKSRPVRKAKQLGAFDEAQW
jgi:2-C-methyl-D-erythritol 4-phosphate cytidylyltransferase